MASLFCVIVPASPADYRHVCFPDESSSVPIFPDYSRPAYLSSVLIVIDQGACFADYI